MTSTTSLTEQNRKTVEDLYAAGMRGDVEGLMRHLDDNVVVHEPDFLPYGGEYVGKNDFLRLFGRIGEFMNLAEMTLHYTVADGERVIAVLGIQDAKTGQLNHFAEQSTVRDGKVVDMRLFYYDGQSMFGKTT
jgi:ketosteroid isomerase-like protein